MSDIGQINSLSRKFIQFVSKFQLVKPKKQTEAMNDTESPVETAQTGKAEEVKAVEEVQNDQNQQNEAKSEPDRFKSFCCEIERFIHFLKDNEDLNDYIYKYPQVLQKRVNLDVNELQYVLAEIKDAMSSIKKLKSQNKLIKKEISAVKKSMPRIKDIEISELEAAVSRHDKDLYNRWMKSKWKFDAIEDLMFDVQEKQIALETVNVLINRYLDKVDKFNTAIDEQLEENSTEKPKTESLGASPKSNIPVPPPLPSNATSQFFPLTINILSKSNTRLSSLHRRFRAENRGNLDLVNPISENNKNEPLGSRLNDNNARNNNLSFTSNTFESQSGYSSQSVDNISNSISNNQIDTSSISARQSEDDLEIKNGVQTVLQALFGQRTSPLMITGNYNNSNSNENNEETINAD